MNQVDWLEVWLKKKVDCQQNFLDAESWFTNLGFEDRQTNLQMDNMSRYHTEN